MRYYISRILSVISPVIVIGCHCTDTAKFVVPYYMPPWENVSAEDIYTFAFDCLESDASVRHFTFRVEKKTAWLFMNGTKWQLNPMGAPYTGARYWQNTLVSVYSWKGRFVIETPNYTYGHCSLDQKRSVWEHARLSGASFRGIGPDHSWIVEIYSDQSIYFSLDYGLTHKKYKIVHTEKNFKSDTLTFYGSKNYLKYKLLKILKSRESVEIEVTIALKHGQELDPKDLKKRVLVKLNGRTFDGAGNTLSL